MDALLQDIRYALRALAKSPGFTAAAVIALALGIGANTAMFSVVNGVLLRPLPYREPGRLLMLYSSMPQFRQASVSYPNFLDWQQRSRSFDRMAAYRPDNMRVHVDFKHYFGGSAAQLPQCVADDIEQKWENAGYVGRL